MFQPSVKKSKGVVILNLITIFSVTTAIFTFCVAQQESASNQIHLEAHKEKTSSIDNLHYENGEQVSLDGRPTSRKSEDYQESGQCEKQAQVDGKVECPSVVTDYKNKYGGPMEENVMYATSSSSSIFSMEVLEDVLDQVEQSGAKVMEKLGGVMQKVSSSKDKMMEKLDSVMDKMKSSKTMVMEELDHIIDEVSHSKVIEEIRALPREIRESFVLSVRNRSYVAAGVMVAIATAILVGGAIYFAWCHHDALDYHIMPEDEPNQSETGPSSQTDSSHEVPDSATTKNGPANINGCSVNNHAPADSKIAAEECSGDGDSSDVSKTYESLSSEETPDIAKESKEELLISKYARKPAQMYGMYSRENSASPCACSLPHIFPHTSCKKCGDDETPISPDVKDETIRTSSPDKIKGVATVEGSPKHLHNKEDKSAVIIKPDKDMMSKIQEKSPTKLELLEPNPVRGPEI